MLIKQIYRMMGQYNSIMAHFIMVREHLMAKGRDVVYFSGQTEANTRAIGIKIKLAVMVDSSMPIVPITSVTGSITKPAGLVNTNTPTEQATKVSGRTTCPMASALSDGKMDLHTAVSSLKEGKKGSVSLNGASNHFTPGLSTITGCTETALSAGLTAASTRDSFKIASCTE